MPRLNLLQGEATRRKVTEQQAQYIEQLYIDCANEIEKQADKLYGKGGSYIFQSQQLSKLEDKIIKQINNIGYMTEQNIIGGLYDVSKAVSDDVTEWLKETGIMVEGALLHVPNEAVMNVTLGRIYDKRWFLSEAIWGNCKRTQKEIEDIVAKGLAQNKSSYDIAKDLEKYVDPSVKKDWEWSKVYPNTSKRIEYNAQRLARTLTAHAYQNAMVLGLQKNPFVKGVKWLNSNNHERLCELCRERAGSDNYGLGAGVYPLNQLPLDHPNGLCTFEVVMDDSMAIANRLGDWANGKRDSALDEWGKYLLNTNGDLSVRTVNNEFHISKK